MVIAGICAMSCSGSAASPPAPMVTERAAEAMPVASATVAPTVGATSTVEVVSTNEPVATAAPAVAAAPPQPVATTIVMAPEPTATPELPVRPPPVTVAMILGLSDRSFAPHQIHGNAGDTVALTFTGGTEAHTFTVTSLGIDVAIGARETKQFSFVMPVEGEVPFFCKLHGSATSGMHGLLIFH